jgi:sigma-B regulation protein RsbU (phosphoserine phosphatase)
MDQKGWRERWQAAERENARLRAQLKERGFQVNYRVVELEALYEVGLAIASTLDLRDLTEVVLLRAVSLLDARRGALYLVRNGRLELERSIGGDAVATLPLGEADGALPGASHLLTVPIEVDERPRGLLVVGDKESRAGVGPFAETDARTLRLFANQAAIALENARLHQQALEKERLEREMQLAAEIQKRLLPKDLPASPGYEICGWNRSARQIGGDYYDFLSIADHHLGLVIADVSGKGMPAALLVSTLHSALRLLIDRHVFDAALLERLNRHILDSSAPNKFITLFLGDLDFATGDLRYLNAGHNPALVVRRDGHAEVLRPGGLPLGLFPGVAYQPESIRLEPGEMLCLYSDGITECFSPADEEFSIDRLASLLSERHAAGLPEIVQAIDEATTGFAAGLPQADDQTVVLIRRQ